MSTTELAKAIMRRIKPRDGQFMSLTVNSEPLLERLMSLAETSGVGLSEPHQAHVNVLELPLPSGTAIPSNYRDIITRIPQGRRMVVVVDTEGLPIERTSLGTLWAERLKLAEAELEPAGRYVVIEGVRRATLSTAERKMLRRVGHGIEATVLVGKGGLGSGLVEAALDALERHGIVKVKLTRGATVDKDDGLQELAWSCGAEVVQRVGKTAVLRRLDIPLDPPVTRRG